MLYVVTLHQNKNDLTLFRQDALPTAVLALHLFSANKTEKHLSWAAALPIPVSITLLSDPPPPPLSLTCISSLLSCLLLACTICAQPFEIYVDKEEKLTLHGLRQYYIKLAEAEKNRKLNDLLDALEFNQVVIFCSKVERAIELNRLLTMCNFPSTCLHSRMQQDQR